MCFIIYENFRNLFKSFLYKFVGLNLKEEFDSQSGKATDESFTKEAESKQLKFDPSPHFEALVKEETFLSVTGKL